jgi:hypothetical protein
VIREGEKVVGVETVSAVCWNDRRLAVWVRFVTNTGRIVEVGSTCWNILACK